MHEENTAATNGCGKTRSSTQNEAALLALMEKTGYSMVQENGQRKFGGPPPGKHLFEITKLRFLFKNSNTLSFE